MDRIEPVQPQEEQEHEHLGDIQRAKEMNFLSLKGYFGKDNVTPDEEDALNAIYDMVAGDEMREMGNVLLFLRDVENRLGATPLGQSRISHVYNYLKLQSQVRDIQQQIQAYERV